MTTKKRYVTVSTLKTLRAAYWAGRMHTRGLGAPVEVSRLAHTLRAAYELGLRERGKPFRVGDAAILSGVVERLHRELDAARTQVETLRLLPDRVGVVGG